jgi:hypothetical protein
VQRIRKGIVYLNRNGDLRLSPDLVPETSHAIIIPNSKTLVVRLQPAPPVEKHAVKLSSPRPKIAKLSFRQAIANLGSERHAAWGYYRGRLDGSEVIISLAEKVRVVNGKVQPIKRNRFKKPFRRNSAIGRAFELCLRGTTIQKLQAFCSRAGVDSSRVLRELLDKETTGCDVKRNGNTICLIPKRRRRKKAPSR